MPRGLILLNEKFLPAATYAIKNANVSILIATFKAEITHKPRGRKLVEFFTILSEKANKGVDVRLLVNTAPLKRSIPYTNAYVAHILQDQGVKVRCLQNNRVCHAKLLIIDNYAAILGSHNLSVKSCQTNFEVSYIFYDMHITEQLMCLYYSLWETARKA